MGDVKLVIIDPISAYLGIGKLKSSAPPTCELFLLRWPHSPLKSKVAVVGVIHFNKKNGCDKRRDSRIFTSLGVLVQSRATSMV